MSRYPPSGGPLSKSECASLRTDRQRAGHDRDGAASGASIASQDMPNLMLEPDELRNLIAYILTLKTPK